MLPQIQLVTKAKQKEDALFNSEKSLEIDTLNFDKFLKKNDAKARDAIKKAEVEAKKKNEKIQEIKRLRQKIQVSQSEISKLKEQLDLCQQYREVINLLTCMLVGCSIIFVVVAFSSNAYSVDSFLPGCLAA